MKQKIKKIEPMFVYNLRYNLKEINVEGFQNPCLFIIYGYNLKEINVEGFQMHANLYYL